MVVSTYVKVIEDLISSGKWIKNDIGMGRIICGKILKKNEKPMAVIVASYLDKPLYTRIEQIIVDNNEIILFYDGEYPESIKKEEREDYVKDFSQNEWNILFQEDSCLYLQKENMISETEGVYFEPHISMRNFITQKHDEKASREVNEYYKL